jgi:chaperonin GroES
MINIRPLYDRIIVRRDEEIKESAGGIIIPDVATDTPVQGEVLAVGNGKITETGELKALSVAVGDKIIFVKTAGTEIKVDGETLLVLTEFDVMGIVV